LPSGGIFDFGSPGLEAKPGVRMDFLDGIDRIYGMGERGEVQS
jgi:hypothetical protein